MKELYKTLKDHKNGFMQDLVQSSYQTIYQDEVQRFMNETDEIDLEECGGESVVRVIVVNQSFQPSLSSAISKMEDAKLQIDRFGFNETSAEITGDKKDQPERLSDKLTVLINDIGIAMKKLDYALHRGQIYRKEPASRYTYLYKCEPRAFVNSLAANEFFKGRLLKDMKRVTDILSDPYCEVIRPITIDYDLIEVNDGKCWSVRERRFIDQAIEDDNKGLVTPRAFCRYDCSTPPQPEYFKEILENSLTENEVATFCEDFLKLLNYNRKRHKDKVPCLVGQTNSGKTSLFMPILGIIHHSNVATITKQRVFNKAMISNNTEVIFIDEATESTMDIDDWKVLTQGGYAAYDVKYQTAKSFINRCPMIITAQRKLRFKPEDQPAMERRLRTYSFKSLQNPKKRAAAWLRNHPMDCIVWAAERARSDEDETNSSGDEGGEDCQVVGEGLLPECEKEALRTLSLVEDEVAELAQTESNLHEDESSSDEDENEQDEEQTVGALERALQKCVPDSLRHRQIAHLLHTRKQLEKDKKEREEYRYRQRKEVLISKGISPESADLLPRDELEPMPSPLREELLAYHQDVMKANSELRREKAREAYDNQWVTSTEKELQDCVMWLNTSIIDEQHRAALASQRELLCDKLKTHLSNLGLLNCEEALEERRRKCISLGLLAERNKNLVRSVYEPLPLFDDIAVTSTSEDDERDMFITPVPRQSAANTRKRVAASPSCQGNQTSTLKYLG